jgi:hypothetical protein
MFVVPVVTLVGWIMDQPMNLNFRLFDTTILVLTVLIVTLIIQVLLFLSTRLQHILKLDPIVSLDTHYL